MSKAKKAEKQIAVDLTEIMDVTVVESNDVRVTCKHAVESDLVYGLDSRVGILEALSPVEVKFGDLGIKIPFNPTMKVLVGHLFRQDNVFRVTPVNALEELTYGGHPSTWQWETITQKGLDVLVRTSWSAAGPLTAPHSTEQERRQFEQLQKKRGAKFIQMKANASNPHDAKWGMDYVVYPMENVMDKIFLPSYIARKESQPIYDFGHGHLFIQNWVRKQA